MHVNDTMALCVVPGTPSRRSLSGADAAVVVVIIIVAAVLAADGVPVREVMALLDAAALLSASVTRPVSLMRPGSVTRPGSGAAARAPRRLARAQSDTLPR
ncbi:MULTISPECIES: hypothetical protein [unclassified Streptomyces]|uniref:hypothetical protein n=1 Tax=unclassified Streptomyces TaxID=2593676 RepID=UPI001891F0F2|nr:hypothetical protein [Streptomyces sp. SUK 48]